MLKFNRFRYSIFNPHSSKFTVKQSLCVITLFKLHFHIRSSHKNVLSQTVFLKGNMTFDHICIYMYIYMYVLIINDMTRNSTCLSVFDLLVFTD